MNRKVFSLVGVFLLFAVTEALAQAPEPAPPAPIPVTTRAEIDCTGFITTSRVPEDIIVYGGHDNDFEASLRQFSTGDLVYLRSLKGANIAVGTEYSIVRSQKKPLPSYIEWYDGQRGSVRSLGHVYEDVGRIKVTRLTPQAPVAEVTFACGPIYPHDLVLPYQPRAIPEYTPTTRLDPFVPSQGKLEGAITAASNNEGLLGDRKIVYVNLGESDGARPGQRFLITRVLRDRVEPLLLASPDTPRETVGELVILFTQERSSVAKIVSSSREVFAGDVIVLQ